MKKRILALLAVTALTVSAFAGCGSSGSTSSASASGSGSGSASSSGETASTGDAEYHIRVGHVLANTHPYEMGLKENV